MEKIKQALERARQERQVYNGNLGSSTTADSAVPIQYTQTRSVRIPKMYWKKIE